MIFLVQFGINKHLLIFLRSQICQSLKKFTRAYLLQIALEIMWLPIQIALYSVQLPELKCLLDTFPFLWVGLHFSSMMFKNASIT